MELALKIDEFTKLIKKVPQLKETSKLINTIPSTSSFVDWHNIIEILDHVMSERYDINKLQKMLALVVNVSSKNHRDYITGLLAFTSAKRTIARLLNKSNSTTEERQDAVNFSKVLIAILSED